ncbi:hypothetical protein BW13_08460 [Bifidobacterium sp. UTCIF-37]|uniref:hypothetical protein n=1 Tax=Bifidobacterium sp. UTCIF-38 TaxID=1465260 RepID=UPI001129D399|nr:hypothetical protein [Bifidobacterium sp. UTCIF-38]TPF85878.1 hypothetical protein BW13_08460 [Bifidobacterium sp. UTCIF-37]TPF87750.1 hypothetical protein BW11_09855 [Bifidobacterium sp. UTCIF-38]
MNRFVQTLSNIQSLTETAQHRVAEYSVDDVAAALDAYGLQAHHDRRRPRTRTAGFLSGISLRDFSVQALTSYGIRVIPFSELPTRANAELAA